MEEASVFYPGSLHVCKKKKKKKKKREENQLALPCMLEPVFILQFFFPSPLNIHTPVRSVNEERGSMELCGEVGQSCSQTTGRKQTGQ